MNLLLDTHIAIWALNDDPALSAKARGLILDPGNTVYRSAVSVWEVLLKHAHRPESIPFDEKDFVEGCHEAGYVSLPIVDKHVLTVRTLLRPTDAKEHNDPFDGLLLAQAKAERMMFLTHNELISAYGEGCVFSV